MMYFSLTEKRLRQNAKTGYPLLLMVHGSIELPANVINTSEIDRRVRRIIRVELLFMTACTAVAALCALTTNVANTVTAIFGGLVLGCAWHLLVFVTLRLAGRWRH